VKSQHFNSPQIYCTENIGNKANMDAEFFDYEEFENECLDKWVALTPREREVLKCLCKDGPLWDGDIPSKQGRDSLLDKNLAVRAMFKDQFGYTVATYAGGHVWRAARLLGAK
jgi:hypothetical protein